MIISWLALAVALTASAVGQVYYKLFFNTRNKWHFVAAIFFFLLTSPCAYVALRQISVGIVNMSTALVQLMVISMAHYWLRERIQRDHIIAMALIIAGVIIYAL